MKKLHLTRKIVMHVVDTVWFSLPAITVFICAISCDRKQAIKLESDEDKLLIFDKISSGSVYQNVKKQIPDLPELSPQLGKGTEKYNLNSSYWRTTLFDKKAFIEFNFSHDTLTAYYFFLTVPDSVTGWETYRKLQQFYKEHYGDFEEKAENDVEGTVYSTHWNNKKSISIALSVFPGTYTIGWGY